jgi:hypothetical protein
VGDVPVVEVGEFRLDVFPQVMNSTTLSDGLETTCPKNRCRRLRGAALRRL